MKKALVVSGGGSKGAFAVGVLKELYQMYPQMDFDIYVGSSTGSLVVSLTAADKLDNLEHLYTTVTDKDIYLKGNIVDKLNDNAIFDISSLWKLVQKNYTDNDYENLLISGKSVYLTTVCLQTNELNVFTNDTTPIQNSGYRVVPAINADHFRRAMLASCSQPVFMQPIKVGSGVPGAENPDYQYVDGGVLEYVGLRMAIDAGATDILVIQLAPDNEQEVNPEYKDLLSILGVTVDILVSDVGNSDVKIVEQYNSALKYIAGVKAKMKSAGISSDEIEDYFNLHDGNIFQGKEPVNIIKIAPYKPLGGGPGGLHFNPDEMKKMLANGKLVFNDVASSGVFDSFWV